MIRNRIRGKGIKQQLLLGSKRTINKALWQTFVLDVVKLADGSPIRLWKKSDMACGGVGPLQSKRRDY